MLAKDCVYPQEPLNFLIHCRHGMRCLLWIQRRRHWQLSAVRRTHYSNFLIMWRGGHAGQVFISCGFLVGVFAWRHHRSRIGSGCRSFTVVIFLQQVECGGQVAIVDSFDTLFGVQVKESFRGFGSRRFCALTQSLQVKSLLIPCSGFKVLNILIFFLLIWGGDVSVFVF